MLIKFIYFPVTFIPSPSSLEGRGNFRRDLISLVNFYFADSKAYFIRIWRKIEKDLANAFKRTFSCLFCLNDNAFDIW